MSELATPRNTGLKFRMLRRLARFVQRYRPRGIDRFLRAVYHPNKRQSDHIDVAIEYDDDLLINVDTASFIEWSIFFYGHYEPEICRLIKRVLKPGNVAFDVGANIGCHALIMARSVGDSGRVLAIEPNPHVHARLIENIRLNRVRHLATLQCGVSDTAGQSTLHVAPNDFPNQGMSSIYSQPLLSRGIPIELITLDEIMDTKAYEKVDFIKIDTQGNDDRVLLGADEVIERYRPYVLFEYSEAEWGRSNADFAACDKLFQKRGYSLYVLGSSGTLTKVAHGLPREANIFAIPPC